MRHRHETHVVIVVRMRRDAVCKGSIARTGANARSKHPAVASRFRHDRSANNVRRGFGSACQNDADGIAYCNRSSPPSLDGRFTGNDEFRHAKRWASGRHRHNR